MYILMPSQAVDTDNSGEKWPRKNICGDSRGEEDLKKNQVGFRIRTRSTSTIRE